MVSMVLADHDAQVHAFNKVTRRALPHEQCKQTCGRPWNILAAGGSSMHGVHCSSVLQSSTAFLDFTSSPSAPPAIGGNRISRFCLAQHNVTKPAHDDNSCPLSPHLFYLCLQGFNGLADNIAFLIVCQLLEGVHKRFSLLLSSATPDFLQGAEAATAAASDQ
jgi:hypothetical protein